MRCFADLLRSVQPLDPTTLVSVSVSDSASASSLSVDSTTGASSTQSSSDDGARTPTNPDTALRPAPPPRRPPRTTDGQEDDDFYSLRPSRSASSTASSVIRLALPEDEAREGLPYTILTGGVGGLTGEGHDDDDG
jgi:hypothetical protein